MNSPTVNTGKRVCVRTHPHFTPVYWLHALDPLEPGRASFVRSEWRLELEYATVFPSRGYAEDVANNPLNPKRYKWVVVKVQ